MSLPTLTPTSTQSAIILPVTGTISNVAAACPMGVYNSSDEFLSGAVKQVKFTYKRLGGDVLDIELTAKNVYNHYEEAVLEYSYQVNLHQSINALCSALGSPTGSFDEKGALTSGEDVALKYPKFQFDYAFKIADKFSTESVVGGTTPIYSASFTAVADTQDYDLQSILSASSVSGTDQGTGNAVPWANLVGDKKVEVRKVYWKTANAMWRFYGYYGGLNAVGNLSSYGQYSDDSSFEVIPTWQNKLQAAMFEDAIYTRASHFSYELRTNMLRLFPTPNLVTATKYWIEFTIPTDPYSDNDPDIGILGVNNMNTLPFEKNLGGCW